MARPFATWEAGACYELGHPIKEVAVETDIDGAKRRASAGCAAARAQSLCQRFGRDNPGRPVWACAQTCSRRIFREYVAGKTPREIAYALNKDRIRPPRVANCTSSTVNGNKKRHHGIILNELYAGIGVWNHVRMTKDPDTGRRISRVNPPEEWKRAEAPGPAIIDKDLFDAAQRRKADRSRDAPERQRKAKFPLSGLLKCGCCGGGLSMKDCDHGRVRIHCSTMREDLIARVTVHARDDGFSIEGRLALLMGTPNLYPEHADRCVRAGQGEQW